MLLQVLLVAVTCGAYVASSSWLIMVNRFLMTKDGFSFPLILSGIGMLFTWIATSILVQFDSVVPRQQVCFHHIFLIASLPCHDTYSPACCSVGIFFKICIRMPKRAVH